MRHLFVLGALLLALVPTVASAQTCQPDAFRQADLAGSYVSAEAAMQVTVYPCGSIGVRWSNVYGTHEAGYYGVIRYADGAILARLAMPDPVVGSLDNRPGLIVKPAEPGYIQVLTPLPEPDQWQVYRLRKTA